MDFFTSLETYLNHDQIELLKKSLNAKSKKGLLLNTFKMSKEEFIKLFPKIKQHPFVENGFIYNINDYDFNRHIFHEMGVYYLQEPSSMIVSSLLGKSQNQYKVLDLCSAPGGKLIQFALNNPQSTIIANDISFTRLQSVVENVERIGLDNVVISNNDFSKIYHKYREYFDIIILDAPCSGSGMFRKNEEIKNDWSFNKVIKYSNIQKQLIDISHDMLKPGGKLIYSTCSFSFEENEEVVLYALNKYTDFKNIDIEIKDKFYQDYKTKLGFHMFPYLFDGEGQYVAILIKDGNLCFNNTNSHEMKYQDYIYKINHKIKIDDLNIIRYGVKYKKIIKNSKEVIYQYHYCHSLQINNDFSLFPVIDLSMKQARTYVEGQNIDINHLTNVNNAKYILLTYQNIPLSFAKSVNNQLKNIFPKYLKNKKYIF